MHLFEAKAKTGRVLTGPQRRALAWLPADGSWSGEPKRMGPAVDRLCLYHRDLAEAGWADAGPRGGRRRRARLLPAGVAMRAAETVDAS